MTGCGCAGTQWQQTVSVDDFDNCVVGESTSNSIRAGNLRRKRVRARVDRLPLVLTELKSLVPLPCEAFDFASSERKRGGPIRHCPGYLRRLTETVDGPVPVVRRVRPNPDRDREPVAERDRDADPLAGFVSVLVGRHADLDRPVAKRRRYDRMTERFPVDRP